MSSFLFPTLLAHAGHDTAQALRARHRAAHGRPVAATTTDVEVQHG